MKPEQITAWALDEASAEERQQLEAALLENPQDKVKADETKAFCDFLLSELRDDSLALTDKQRERLVAQAKQPVGQTSRLPDASETLAPQPEAGGKAAKTTRWNFGVIVRLSLAACAVLGGFWTWQTYSEKNRAARDLAAVVVEEKPAIKVQLAPKPEAKRKVDDGAEARRLVEAQNKALVKMEPQAAKQLAAAPVPAPVAAPAAAAPALALNTEQRGMSRADVERLKQVQDQYAYGLDFGGGIEGFRIPAAGGVGGSGVIAQKMEMDTAGAVSGAAAGRGVVVGSGGMLMRQGWATVNDGREFRNEFGFIGLHTEPDSRQGRLSLFKNHWISLSGILSEPWLSHYWQHEMIPSMPNANSLELVSLPAGASLADYESSVAFGDVGLHNRGSALLVVKAANGSTGSILVQAGAPLTLDAFLQQRSMPFVSSFRLIPDGDKYFKGIGIGFPSYGWIPLPQEVETNSPGLISFATAASSELNDSRDSSSISAADQQLLGGLLPGGQSLAGNPATLGDASGVSEMQAAVFNGNGMKVRVDMKDAPATMTVTRELDYAPGAKAPASQSSFTFGRTSGVAMSDAPAVGDASAVQPGGLAGAGTMIATGSTAVPSTPVAHANSGAMGTSQLGLMKTSPPTGEVVMISGLPKDVVAPAEPEGLKISPRQESDIRNYMAANRYIVGDTAGAFSNPDIQGSNSLWGGNVVAGTTLSRSDVGAPEVIGSVRYTGQTTINGGSLRPSVNSVVAGAPAAVNDDLGIIAFTGYDANKVWYSMAAPEQAGAVTISGTVSGPTRDGVTLRERVTGDGGLTKTGAGALVLNGATNYTGGTAVNRGTLNVSGGAMIQSGDGFAPTGEVILGGKSQVKRNAGGALTLSGGVLASASPAEPAAKPVAGAAPVPQKPSGPAPVSGDLGMTVSIGYDSNYVWRGNDFGENGGRASKSTNAFQSPALSATVAPDSVPASVSLNYSFIKNMGSLANGGGLNQNSGNLGGYGMNDIQQLTLGVNTNLGPTSYVDLNEPVKVAAAAASNPGAVPMIGTGEIMVFNSTSAVVQNPQAGAAGANAIPLPSAAPVAELSTVQSGLMLANASVTDEAKVPVPGGSAVMGKDEKTDAFYFGNLVMTEERKTEPQRQPSAGESYTRIIENEMKEVAREPLSTLSIDVDTASYANVRRFLNQNMIPPPDAVRIEELVNYFPTSEEGPAHDAKEPFGVRVELAPCPWQPVHRLARIAIKGRELDKDRKASNLVFLVDVSGSMNEPTKLPLVQQSLRMLTEQLVEGDRVTMVVYAGSSGVVLPPTGGERKEEILAAISRLSAGGSTHGSAGIKLAYEQAVAGFIKGGVNRVILCTDGDFNVGVSSPEELEKLIKHKAKSGVFLSVLGFGSGNLKDRTMETLADKGNGNYAYIDSLSEARKVLVEQMSGTLVTIAKDVKIQVEFNPAAVRSYRLIGYENRLLAKEDFNDDTKDAGEIGAGHSVVALYEVVPANLPAGGEGRPAVDSLKYQAPAISPAQLAEAAKSGEMMTVKLRYKEPESDLSKLIEVPTKDEGKTLTASTEEFKFSAAVAGFGLLLRDSSYKGTLSWETVRRLALDGKGADKQGYRGEFLQLIDKARGLKETR